MVQTLARKFVDYSDQYRIFGEFPELDGASISLFLDVAGRLNAIPNISLRGNALGTFQATVGIWQILARQGQIPSSELNDSWQRTVKPFAAVRSAAQVFDAGRASLGEVVRTAFGKSYASQDEIIELLAGPEQTIQKQKRRIRNWPIELRPSWMASASCPLDTLFALGMVWMKLRRENQPTVHWFQLAGQIARIRNAPSYFFPQ